MNDFQIKNIEAMQDFPNQSNQLAVISRSMPENACSFFKKLLELSFNITGEISKERSVNDIQCLLSDNFPEEIQKDFLMKHGSKTWLIYVDYFVSWKKVIILVSVLVHIEGAGVII